MKYTYDDVDGVAAYLFHRGENAESYGLSAPTEETGGFHLPSTPLVRRKWNSPPHPTIGRAFP